MSRKSGVPVPVVTDREACANTYLIMSATVGDVDDVTFTLFPVHNPRMRNSAAADIWLAGADHGELVMLWRT